METTINFIFNFNNLIYDRKYNLPTYYNCAIPPIGAKVTFGKEIYSLANEFEEKYNCEFSQEFIVEDVRIDYRNGACNVDVYLNNVR